MAKEPTVTTPNAKLASESYDEKFDRMKTRKIDDEFGKSAIYWVGLLFAGNGNPDYQLSVVNRMLSWSERRAKR